MKRNMPEIYDIITVITAAVIVFCSLQLSTSPLQSRILDTVRTALDTAEKTSAVLFSSNSALATQTEEKKAIKAEETALQNTITVTPADIIQLTESAKVAGLKDSEDGKIEEKNYTTNSTSTIIGNIAVRNNTTTQQNINLLKYYNEAPDIKVPENNQPAVLLFHSHTTESYELLDRGWYAQDYLTRSNSSDRNMIRIGIEIKEQLEKAGYKVIHDTQIHDEKYTGAYDHSRKSVQAYLEQYPSIQIVLDIHRDAIELDNGTRIKPTAEIMGKKAAQLMIISGCEEGKVKNFPEWEYNLTFALKLQSICEKLYPGLMRPLYFCQRKYNMDCSRNNLLIEVGSCANTLEEAAYSGRLLGQSLAKLLDACSDETGKETP